MKDRENILLFVLTQVKLSHFHEVSKRIYLSDLETAKVNVKDSYNLSSKSEKNVFHSKCKQYQLHK